MDKPAPRLAGHHGYYPPAPPSAFRHKILGAVLVPALVFGFYVVARSISDAGGAPDWAYGLVGVGFAVWVLAWVKVRNSLPTRGAKLARWGLIGIAGVGAAIVALLSVRLFA